MSNMEAFNQCTTVVFDLLYDNFPIPIRLNANDLNEGVAEPKIRLYTKTDRHQGDNDTAVKTDLQTYCGTINFWISERLIRNVQEEHLEKMAKFKGSAPYGDSDPMLFPAVTLTAKGLDALNATPTLTQGAPVSFIQRIKKALREQSGDYMSETISALIKTVIAVAI
jgi:hypothetical protein